MEREDGRREGRRGEKLVGEERRRGEATSGLVELQRVRSRRRIGKRGRTRRGAADCTVKEPISMRGESSIRHPLVLDAFDEGEEGGRRRG